MIPCSSIAYTAKRPISSRRAISFTESGNNSGPLPNVVLVGTRNADAVLADGIHFSIHADY